MANIYLHGELKEKFNDHFVLDAQSPKEAVRALTVLVPNFKRTFAEGNYYIYVDNGDVTNIDEDNFHLSSPGDIHIMPEIIGAKRGGAGKVLAGIALIGLSIATGGAAAAAWAVGASTASLNVLAITGLVTSALHMVGMSLLLGGASQLLAPKQNNNTNDTKNQQSYIFDGSDINIQNGSAVPIIYGTVLAAGFPISVDISNIQTNPTTSDTTYNTGAGGFITTPYQTYA